MVVWIFFFVCLGASIIGAICGIGGGVIIKPVLDAMELYDIATISFLSGCTVLSMSAYSVIKARISQETSIQKETSFPLAIGAALGGIMGKSMFSYIHQISQNKESVGGIQAVCLLILTMGTLLYTLQKERIPTMQVRNRVFCMGIGLILGISSAFLGIGGGPINLVVLYYFFSMTTKMAAENSIYIIFFSQITSLLLSLWNKKIPNFTWEILIVMVLGGILGGVLGKIIQSKIENRSVQKLFILVMIFMIGMNIYNIYRFIV